MQVILLHKKIGCLQRQLIKFKRVSIDLKRMKKQEVSIFWFRRDLRIEDNHGLWQALKGEYPVQPVFIFDTNILKKLPSNDARVSFIYKTLQSLHGKFKKLGSSLSVYCGDPLQVWKKIIEEFDVKCVFANRDYEQSAILRDKTIYEFLKGRQIHFKGFKDQVIFEKQEILTGSKTPYTVFTPYSKKWKQTMNSSTFREYDSQGLVQNLHSFDSELMPLESIGFEQSSIRVLPYSLESDLLKRYKENRDFPFLKGTSGLSPHLRFGTVSVRAVCRKVESISESFLNEIIWRDFYAQVLSNFPHVETGNFRPQYDAIEWRNNEEEFKKWCCGETGFPIVDAGMRQLNETGYMHNRVRMITASFLVKDLLIDWKWGEAYFAEKLLDFDLASNNGGWQWAASTGTDAAPYFRIFNPESQHTKFDAKNQYVKMYVPEFGTEEYPKPIVNHKDARERTLAAYKKALGK